MVIFHSYVSLPEGILNIPWICHEFIPWMSQHYLITISLVCCSMPLLLFIIIINYYYYYIYIFKNIIIIVIITIIIVATIYELSEVLWGSGRNGDPIVIRLLWDGPSAKQPPPGRYDYPLVCCGGWWMVMGFAYFSAVSTGGFPSHRGTPWYSQSFDHFN